MFETPLFSSSTPSSIIPPKLLVSPIPRYTRLPEDERPPMRLTDRDRHILEAVQAYDGMLSEAQIKHLFFTGRTATQVRLMLLYQHGYLNRPNRKERAALPVMIYWLGERGAAYVASLTGQPLDDFAWRKEPRWSQVEHDIAVNDVRITMAAACHTQTGFTLHEWIPASEFHAYPDKVAYTLPNKTTTSRFVRPDGYCVISKGEYTSRLLIELDRSTEDNPRLTREKFLPGVAYIRSEAYKQRFGYSSGRWLFITTSDRRLRNMKRTAENAVKHDAKLFYFTTINRVSPDAIFMTPIWFRGGDDVPTTLFPLQ